MVDIGIREQPRLHFARVQALQQAVQLGIRFQDFVEGQSVVDLVVELKRVDLVVTSEALNGESIFLVVLLMKHMRIFLVEDKVFDEEFV